jgi:PAS domain S-box-containing protein
LIVLDNEGRIREINREAEKIFAVVKSGVMGEKIQTSLPLGDFLYDIIDHSSGKREEISLSQSGKPEYYLVDVIPFDDGNAIKSGSILMITCISEWKDKEDKLIEYTEIIEIRNSELNDAYKELKTKQDALKKSEKSLKKAHEIAGLGIFEWNLSTKLIYVSDELFKLFGLSTENGTPTIPDLLKLVKQSNYDLVSTSFDSLIESGTPFAIEFWIERIDGVQCAIRGKGEINQDELNREKYITIIFQDITERKKMEEEIQEAYLEKETLLTEIHHRVKNNMQVISSLLSIQSRKIKDPDIQMMFKETQSRVRSLALVHEQLYQSTNLNRINYREYIQKITTYFLQSHDINKGIAIHNLVSPDIELTIEKAVPCSLILSELLTNSFKHAFRADQTGEIKIKFSFNPLSNLYTFEYCDNGKGFANGTNVKEGIGSTLITGLVRQISGHISINGLDHGVHYSITFPANIHEYR